MGSITGLKEGNFTSVQNTGQFYLTDDLNAGTAGQALISAGEDEPATWGTHTGTIQPLTMGTNVALASGNPSFNGAIADTLNATDTDTQYFAGAGLGLVGVIFNTDNDGTTINNSGGTGTQIQV